MWRCRHIEWPESSQAEGTAEGEGGKGSQTLRGRRTECRLDRVPNALSCRMWCARSGREGQLSGARVS